MSVDLKLYVTLSDEEYACLAKYSQDIGFSGINVSGFPAIKAAAATILSLALQDKMRASALPGETMAAAERFQALGRSEEAM